MTGKANPMKVTAERLKKESAEDKRINKAVSDSGLMDVSESAMAEVAANKELADLYRNNASVGADNLEGDRPYLKIHAAGKSSTNFLENGKKPEDGNFFHAKTKQQWKSVDCHILAISAGFKAPGMKQKNGKTPMVHNQLMAGVITNDGETIPFIMYLTGKKLSPMWAFGKEIRPYTKRIDPLPIPMFSMSVTLSTVEESNDYGTSWVPVFTVNKNEAGHPILVTDPGEFVFLRDQAEALEDTMKEMVSKKAAENSTEEDGTPFPTDADAPVEAEVV